MSTREYDLDERLLNYAAQVICLVDRLPQPRAGNHLAGQLLRSGTSALPNHGEAQAAGSQSDFVHTLSIGLKELRTAAPPGTTGRSAALAGAPAGPAGGLAERERIEHSCRHEVPAQRF